MPLPQEESRSLRNDDQPANQDTNGDGVLQNPLKQPSSYSFCERDQDYILIMNYSDEDEYSEEPDIQPVDGNPVLEPLNTDKLLSVSDKFHSQFVNEADFAGALEPKVESSTDIEEIRPEDILNECETQIIDLTLECEGEIETDSTESDKNPLTKRRKNCYQQEISIQGIISEAIDELVSSGGIADTSGKEKKSLSKNQITIQHLISGEIDKMVGNEIKNELPESVKIKRMISNNLTNLVTNKTSSKKSSDRGQKASENSYMFEGVICLPSLYEKPPLPVEEINSFNESKAPFGLQVNSQTEESKPFNQMVNTSKKKPKKKKKLIIYKYKSPNKTIGITKTTAQDHSIQKSAKEDYWDFLLKSMSTETKKFHGFSLGELKICSDHMEDTMRNINRHFIPVIYQNHNRSLYKCVNCSYTTCFPSSVETKRHISRHEDDEEMLKCSDCEFISFVDEVATHIFHKHGKKLTFSEIVAYNNESVKKGTISTANDFPEKNHSKELPTQNTSSTSPKILNDSNDVKLKISNDFAYMPNKSNIHTEFPSEHDYCDKSNHNQLNILQGNTLISSVENESKEVDGANELKFEIQNKLTQNDENLSGISLSGTKNVAAFNSPVMTTNSPQDSNLVVSPLVITDTILLSHMRKTCSICKSVEKTCKDLVLHVSRVHGLPDDKNPHLRMNQYLSQLRTCSLCGFVASNRKNVFSHCLNLHFDTTVSMWTLYDSLGNISSDLKLRTCNYCGFIAKDSLALSKHSNYCLSSEDQELFIEVIFSKHSNTEESGEFAEKTTERLVVTSVETSKGSGNSKPENIPASNQTMRSITKSPNNSKKVEQSPADDKSFEQSLKNILIGEHSAPKTNKTLVDIPNALESIEDEGKKKNEDTLNIARNQVISNILKLENVEDDDMELEINLPSLIQVSEKASSTDLLESETPGNLLSSPTDELEHKDKRRRSHFVKPSAKPKPKYHFSCGSCEFKSNIMHDITKHLKYCVLNNRSKSVRKPRSMFMNSTRIDNTSVTSSINNQSQNITEVDYTQDVYPPIKTEFADMSYSDDFKIKSEIKVEEDQSDPLSMDADVDIDAVESLVSLSRASMILACGKCDYIAESDSVLKTHELQHTKPTNARRNFKRRSPKRSSKSLSDDEDSNDKISSDKSVCELCNYAATTKKSLMSHIEYAHINGTSEAFENNTSHLRNIEEYDTTCNMYSMRFRKCQTCGFVAATRHGLVQHARSRHGRLSHNLKPPVRVRAKNFTVPLEKFQNFEMRHRNRSNSNKQKSSYTLQKNVASNQSKNGNLPKENPSLSTGDIPGTKSLFDSLSEELKTRYCEFCGMIARTKGGLTYHVSITHSGTSKKRLSEKNDSICCENCAFLAHNKYQLNFHQKMVHSKTFSCLSCAYKAKDRNLVALHIDSCNKEPSQDSSLKNSKPEDTDDDSKNTNNKKQAKTVERVEKLQININQLKVYENRNYGVQIKDSNVNMENVVTAISSSHSNDKLNFNMLPRSSLSCKICSFKALDLVTLGDHVFGHENGLHPCNFCPFMTREIWNLKRHKSQMHSNSVEVTETEATKLSTDKKRKSTTLSSDDLHQSKKCKSVDEEYEDNKCSNTKNIESNQISSTSRRKAVLRNKDSTLANRTVKQPSEKPLKSNKKNTTRKTKKDSISREVHSEHTKTDLEGDKESLEDLDLENLLDHIQIDKIETKKRTLDKKQALKKADPKCRRVISKSRNKARCPDREASGDCDIPKGKTNKKSKCNSSGKMNVVFKCPYCDFKAKFRHALETHFDASHID